MPSFRAKARAVDLLGKGQIADLPTAISELWKNGYDACADNLSCHHYQAGYEGIKSPIFTLSDDGLGMSDNDLKDKWLVLGTDDKARAMTAEDSPCKRIPMGQKGIGRLSVSYLGTPMLMLTKQHDKPGQALFMDWRILDNYSLYLDEVSIPIEEVTSPGKVQDIFLKIVDQFEKNLDKNSWKKDKEYKSLAKEILDDLKNLALPDFLVKDILPNFLGKGKQGTIFVIFNPIEQLTSISTKDLDDEATAYIRSSLCGFHNAFRLKESVKSPISTSFWIHDAENLKYDLVDKVNFFVREEIFEADHWLEGKVDEEGFFSGKVQVFNEVIPYTFRPSRPPGPTPYGPFQIEFGDVEGDAKNSKLPREKWDVYSKKLKSFGGLYVYRDGFRVLPYGRTDYDWLEFEERRTRGATYYTFSHRRILGYIEISRERNSALKEKAGREGFINNKAYQELREDLIKLFIDLSVRYFRTKKGEPTLRQKQLVAIRKEKERLRKAEQNKEANLKKQLRKDLKANIKKIDTLSSELRSLQERLSEKVEQAIILYKHVADILNQLENKKLELDKLWIVEPTRYKLTGKLAEQYEAYRDKYNDSLTLATECKEAVESIYAKLKKEDLQEEYKKRYQQLKGDILNSARRYRTRFSQAVQELNMQITNDISTFGKEFDKRAKHLKLDDDSSKVQYEAAIRTLEDEHDEIKREIDAKYDSFTRHVEQLSFDVDEDQLVGIFKSDYEELEVKAQAMHELAQLGMAIEIIDHQFNVLYAQMTASINYFNRFVQDHPEAKRNYRQLRLAFEHLETNHQLLTPLYRTTRRTRVDITGAEISDYLCTFFERKFEESDIKFTTDPAFDEYTFYTFESVIKPVFINVVNNAIYWLESAENRRIHITYEDDKILVMNSGEKIEPVYIEDVFTLFFSRKPGGRGIGLYLARTNLRTIGYDIRATNESKLNRLNGACFIIEKYGARDEL